MATLLPRQVEKDDATTVYSSNKKDHNEACNVKKEAGTLTLKRKVAMCAGLMGSETMSVFSNLNTMPLLQALGSPVYLLTLPGVMSSILGLIFVPLMGWINDSGSNPQKRKKPITMATFCVGLLGLSLNLSAAILSSQENKALTNHTVSSFSISNTTTTTTTNDTSPDPVNSSLLLGSQGLFAGLEQTSHSQTDLLNDYSKVITDTEEADTSLYTMVTKVLGGLPMPVIASMAGFVFMDFGFDLSNSAVKALMLTHSALEDHVSLLVSGVFMAALGGCATSISGLVDLGYLMPDVDPVCSQAIVQLSTLILLSILCCTCSVLSTPIPPTPDQALSSGQLHTDPLGGEDDEEEEDGEGEGDKQSEGEGVDSRRGSWAVPWQEASDTVFFATLTPAEALMSQSTQIERSFMHLSVSASLTHSHQFRHHHHHHHHPHHADNEKVSLLLDRSHRHHNQLHLYEAIPENTAVTKRAASCLDSRKFKLLIVWLAEFFTACSIFVFNVTVADFMGKVIYGGDPMAEAGSEDYSLYQKGMRTAALCILCLNVAYVTSALCQNRVLAAISPKSEYVVANLSFLVLIVVMHQTASLPAVIVCSVVAGVNRTALYTVPFVLATQLCQHPPTEGLSLEEGGQKRESSANFGSTMALVTSALPSAYLVTSSVIGPLIDATGDPSSPFLMAGVCLLMSALTVSCYKQ